MENRYSSQFAVVMQPGPTDTNFFRRADMEDTKVGAGRKDDPADVARQADDALMSGKDHLVAGSMKNKVRRCLTFAPAYSNRYGSGRPRR